MVDDSETNRLLLRELVESPRRRVTLASSGEEALALAQQQLYDLVLMDIRMGGMDGVETAVRSGNSVPSGPNDRLSR